jgi:uncharacterized circularly permuted ATP-grasp superfamily protein
MQTVPDTSGMAYESGVNAWDEACDDSGRVRPHYEVLLDSLADADLVDLAQGVAHDLHSRGAVFRSAEGFTEFRVDPVPRLIESGEWDDLCRGMIQRVRALNAFLADVYDGRRIVEEGLVPRRVLDSAVHHEPWMIGVPVSNGVYAGSVGLDLVRDADGVMRVLEDNARTPSGYTYLLAARDVLDERLSDAATHIEVRSVNDIVQRLGHALRAAAPDGVDDPQVALLTDGSENSAWWEHEGIARELRLTIVTLDDLEVRGGRVYIRDDRDLRPVDVLYRRTDEDRLQDDAGRPTAYGEALLEPLRGGRIGLFNAFGAGVADDKLTHAYVPQMIEFYLGEEPLLPSVDTLDLADPAALERTLSDLDEFVVKERAREGGYGVTICAHASAARLEQVRADLARRPGDFIAQRLVTLSTHPTVIDGRLEPRHVDLRPFVLQTGDDVHVIPGGLTRVAFGEGRMIVNSSQNGGGKDTWVLR